MTSKKWGFVKQNYWHRLFTWSPFWLTQRHTEIILATLASYMCIKTFAIIIEDFHCVIIRWRNLQKVAILVHRLLLKDTRWKCESEEFYRKTSNAFIWQPNYTKKESTLFLLIMMYECSWESFCIRLSCNSVVPLVRTYLQS